ncbi:p-loop containing nucleoside triphosphate hydrolase protein [Favolaschia claudopus]|uniref:P-loop containing nucleoside triphosphate hydrolase protein n=1 Tax=Favolaschia claudopus TaxID=2862362 RepID=A0AAW0CC70_9AGAR
MSLRLDDELAFLATAAAVDNDVDILHHQLITSPLLTYSALERHPVDFPSRALLGTTASERLYVNTNSPSSVVICGVQGAGKSHTVSCLLESALIKDPRIGTLPEPLSALVFHFDTQDANRPCEAAFLSSPAAHLQNVVLPQVTVLCSPSNMTRRRKAYASQPQVRVEPLYLSEQDLTAERMLTLMACDDMDKMPLYMHTALRIIRNMGVDRFSYSEFKRQIYLENLDVKQTMMIELRLNLLDAFIGLTARKVSSYFSAGGVVLVDLTDPFLDGLTASVLFDIVLGTFTQWETPCGKLVVLDEAHKYLVNSDSTKLAQSVSNIIRLQRHLGTRVVIATQEPTVIPSTILDLASTIICHRFSSPAWCTHLARHVSTGADLNAAGWFQQVMMLPTGHALVFSPAAAIAADERGAVLLGREHLRVRIRPRLTLDGGASLLAVRRPASVSAATSTSTSTSHPQVPLPTPPTVEFELPPPPAATPFNFGMPVSAATIIPPTPSKKGKAPILAGGLATQSSAVAPAFSTVPYLVPSSAATIAQPVTLSGGFGSIAQPTYTPPVVPLGASASGEASASSTGASVAQPAPPTFLAVPARLKPLVTWLKKRKPVGSEVKLSDARTALHWVGAQEYPTMQGDGWFGRMLSEATRIGLIEVTNLQTSNVQLKATGQEKTMRLILRKGQALQYI